MEWFKQHADTIVIVTSFVLCFWHLNERITSIEKDVAIIKTSLSHEANHAKRTLQNS